MSAECLLLSDKYKAFIRCDADVEYLEGTTSSGKTTVGIFKFMLKIADSSKKLHIIAADDVGAAEKNIINKDLGILDNFGELVEYKGNGSRAYKMPHIIYSTSSGEKIIFIIGYGNKAKWKDALGGQYGCLYIDEINTADIEFIREASMRSDYVMATLNPDDPELPVYKEYINHARPLQKWQQETPLEIIKELEKEEPNPGWVHWFFSFTHNLGLSKEKLDKIMMNTPAGTKIWKNKIEGLRGKATGLVFPNFTRERNVITESWLRQQLQSGKIHFRRFTASLDTSYSDKTQDTIAMIFEGITNDRRVIVLEESVYNNAEMRIPLAPSDTAVKFTEFLDMCADKWGLAKDVFVDCADQATITELKKYKRLHGMIYNIINSYKKITILDRVRLMLGWITQGAYLVLEHCTEHLAEINRYSWDEDGKEPEDAHNHTIDACCYAWIPYRAIIGYKEE